MKLPFRKSLSATAALLLTAALVISISVPASAYTGSDFRAGNIISGAVFTNSNAMSAADIQNFLNAKVTCDTNGALTTSYYYNSGTGRVGNASDPWVTTSRAVYGQRYTTYNNNNKALAPYVCLKDYVENPATHANNLQHPNPPVPGGASAAQIIYNAGVQYSINPQVLLTTLQKEQGLITDDWPWTSQYQIAMGYACPDTAECDAAYYGFANQVNSAAKQYRRYLTEPQLFNYVAGNNTIPYNVLASCNQSSNVFIENQMTAALYDYTPYQPNANVLAHTNPTSSSSGPGGAVADNCGSYGNRNFWWYFSTWFGSTQTNIPYAWAPVSQTSYTDSAMTHPYTSNVTTVAPDGKAYVQVKARNNGNQNWNDTTVFLGASSPNDRTSIFAGSDWKSPGRIRMAETQVLPGETATFNFSVTAPATAGSYRESYNLVTEGITWMNDPAFSVQIDVVAPVAGTDSTANRLAANQILTANQNIMSADTQSNLIMQGDGNLVLYSDFRPIWSSGTGNNPGSRAVMQGDGNLVIYSAQGVAIWNTQTNNSPSARLVLQTDGNIVVYSAGNAPIWQSGTVSVPDHLSKVNKAIVDATIFPGQSLTTADRKHTLVLQTDGNLVLYSTFTNRATWNSGTVNVGANAAVMQNDGNLVIYNQSGRAVWHTRTNGRGLSALNMQSDGNLVIYNGIGQATWHSSTPGT